jgi:DNA-binding NarL/FixJ family response regulator
MSGSIEWQATPDSGDGNIGGEMDRKIRILIADDHQEVLMATADLIEDFSGIEILSLSANVEDVVSQASEHHPDIAFVDAWLKGGGAEAAAKGIKIVSPATIVVALASAKELELVLKLRAAGAAGCYEKETLSAVLPGILASIVRR